MLLPDSVYELMFYGQYYQEFADAVNYITVKKGAYCILDPHNYMRYVSHFHSLFSGLHMRPTLKPKGYQQLTYLDTTTPRNSRDQVALLEIPLIPKQLQQLNSLRSGLP